MIFYQTMVVCFLKVIVFFICWYKGQIYSLVIQVLQTVLGQRFHKKALTYVLKNQNMHLHTKTSIYIDSKIMHLKYALWKKNVF